MLAALLRGARIKLLTTDYLDVTEPKALARLWAWHGHIDVRVFSYERQSFHPKAYLFEHADGTGRAFIGSANLSRMGLLEGVEWTWTVLDIDAGQPMHELQSRFEELFADAHTKPLTPAWIAAYEARRVVRADIHRPEQEPPSLPAPREVQRLALIELEKLRADGERRALVVAATGLGKTYLAAFDARDARRVLFIAHRDELLRQADATFRHLYPTRSRGMVADGEADYHCDVVLASVQTLSRPEHLKRLQQERFDYVVIDEFHHAAAESYSRLLDVLEPRFLLGITATPFRRDNHDILALCHGNLAYQVGLFEAISFGWLVPFKYFGITDVVEFTDDLLTTRKTYDTEKLTLRFNTDIRANLAIDHFRRHASRAALGFCVSIAHADFMAKQFNAAGIPCTSVHSGQGSFNRKDAIDQLTRGQLRVLFTVDLFNEGVDIPPVDLVMFLRPTESVTIFLQQLGRGLRLHTKKQYLTVLDFIGNYRNAHFKLPLLVGIDAAQDSDPAKALSLLKKWIDHGVRPDGLPDGVSIEIETIALSNLAAALGRGTPLRMLVLSELAAWQSRLGRAPSLTEWTTRAAYTFRTAKTVLGVDRWHGILSVAGLLDEETKGLEDAAGDFLKEIETARMTKSFKIVALAAMTDGKKFQRVIGINDLIAHFRTYFSEERYRDDVAGTLVEDVRAADAATWERYLLSNPIKAWIGGNTQTPSTWFTWDSAQRSLIYIGPFPEKANLQARFAAAVYDRCIAQLHTYWQRPSPQRMIFSVIPTGNPREAVGSKELPAYCIMFGNDRSGLPTGWHLVKINGKLVYGNFVKVALNVLKISPTETRDVPNILSEELHTLFGGQLPPRPRVRLVREPGQAVWEIQAVVT